MRHYRTLFVNDSEDCLKAMAHLESKKIRFMKARVDKDSLDPQTSELPVLITDEGEWRGLTAVLRYP